ncbi:MAG: hypothetical protein WAK55_09770 [Xanthobacteraceae bacterium]|jgi:hypothetical protein
MPVKNRQDDESELPARLDFEAMNSSEMNPSGMDSSGMCFAVAAVIALLAAGTIVYRAANNDVRIASSGATSAPASHLR